MYRIEVAPGEETVFRTLDELAVAVRTGVVTSRARIYHNASQKWLPIEFHPHYKHALKLPPNRHDAPAARTPERAESLSFAVARADEPETPSAAPVPIAPVSIAPVSIAPAVEAPRALEVAAEAVVVEEPRTPPKALPPVVPSPVLQLPTNSFPEEDSEITYPEFARAEARAPDHAGTATRSRRPLHLAGAAAVLALGAYAMMSAFSPSRGDAASRPAVADRPAMPQADAPRVDSVHGDARQPDASRGDAPRIDSEAATPPAAAAAKPARTGARAPAPVAMTEPASSGFAPALESRAIVSTSPATVHPAIARDSSIAPAPAALDLAVPALPGAEALVATPRPQGDSALKRILKAVNGGKDAPRRP
jgi:hypothetical protein